MPAQEWGWPYAVLNWGTGLAWSYETQSTQNSHVEKLLWLGMGWNGLLGWPLLILVLSARAVSLSNLAATLSAIRFDATCNQVGNLCRYSYAQIVRVVLDSISRKTPNPENSVERSPLIWPFIPE
jgi:hypothetical protein